MSQGDRHKVLKTGFIVQYYIYLFKEQVKTYEENILKTQTHKNKQKHNTLDIRHANKLRK